MRLALAALLLLPALAGCSVPVEERADVVATFYPIAFVAERLAGDDLRVGTFVPPGAGPQMYEPTARDVVRVADARLVLYNGEGLEPWLGQLRAATPEATFVAVTAELTFVEDEGFPEDARAEEEDGTRGAARLDPHVWLDPIRMMSIVNATAKALVEAGLEPDVVGARADALRANLAALHVRYEDGLAKCDSRHIFVTRPAYGYLVVRYNLYQHGFSNLHPGSEASPARMARILDLARQYDVDVVFEDPRALGGAVATTFAQEIGGRVAPLDPIEGLSHEQRRAGANYFSAMDANLASLREGLGCAR